MSPFLTRAITNAAADRQARRGFTLVELLTVIVIIGILSTLFLGAVYQAESAAKRARTKALVARIHNRMMARWEEFATRRLPIALTAGAETGNASIPQRLVLARRQLIALRELARMELPDRYADLTFMPTVLRNGALPVRPIVWQAYRQKVHQIAVSRGITDDDAIALVSSQYQGAECLYLIMTLNVDDVSLGAESFSRRDIGDKDLDGMLEFIDAWGNPIEFLRWAPGFISDLQPLYAIHKDDRRFSLFHRDQPKASENPEFLVTRWKIETRREPVDYSRPRGTQRTYLFAVDTTDPFNPLKIGFHRPDGLNWQPGDPPPEYGFGLYPLVVSPGADGKYGLFFGVSRVDKFEIVPEERDYEWSPTEVSGSPLGANSDPYNFYRGSGNVIYWRGESLNPLASPEPGSHLDNIHGQMLDSSLR